MNIPIKKAADLMGISQQFLRTLIKHERLPFAKADKNKETNKRHQYYICSKGLAEHLGVAESEVTG